MASVIIVIMSIMPIFLVLLITVKIIATKIRFTTSAKDEMTTKEKSKYWLGLKLLTVLKTKLSIELKNPR